MSKRSRFLKELIDWLEHLIAFGVEQYPDDPENGLFGTAKRFYKILKGRK